MPHIVTIAGHVVDLWFPCAVSTYPPTIPFTNHFCVILFSISYGIIQWERSSVHSIRVQRLHSAHIHTHALIELCKAPDLQHPTNNIELIIAINSWIGRTGEMAASVYGGSPAHHDRIVVHKPNGLLMPQNAIMSEGWFHSICSISLCVCAIVIIVILFCYLLLLSIVCVCMFFYMCAAAFIVAFHMDLICMWIVEAKFVCGNNEL